MAYRMAGPRSPRCQARATRCVKSMCSEPSAIATQTLMAHPVAAHSFAQIANADRHVKHTHRCDCDDGKTDTHTSVRMACRENFFPADGRPHTVELPPCDSTGLGAGAPLQTASGQGGHRSPVGAIEAETRPAGPGRRDRMDYRVNRPSWLSEMEQDKKHEPTRPGARQTPTYQKEAW